MEKINKDFVAQIALLAQVKLSQVLHQDYVCQPRKDGTLYVMDADYEEILAIPQSELVGSTASIINMIVRAVMGKNIMRRMKQN